MISGKQCKMDINNLFNYLSKVGDNDMNTVLLITEQCFNIVTFLRYLSSNLMYFSDIFIAYNWEIWNVISL